ncbi:hypothetical protein AGMMS49944_22210 [Spirochaetia bacterium]|nr:hypothetical protein AGMMS49944_22210 [Spirochaetia bacterium]
MGIDGRNALEKAAKKLCIDLPSLVAETAIWACPTVCVDLSKKHGEPVWYPKYRRGRPGEKKGQVIKGITIDDNTYANAAIKHAVGISRNDIKKYAACHIWEDTCYDEHCHTAIPNLVLIPNAIAGLSDFYKPVIEALQYRSYALYHWLPKGCPVTVKPKNYPTNWQQPCKGAPGFPEGIAPFIREPVWDRKPGLTELAGPRLADDHSGLWNSDGSLVDFSSITSKVESELEKKRNPNG